MFRGFDEIKAWLGIFLVILFLSGGCSVAEVKLDASNNGGQKELARGQTVVLNLDSNPTTGFSWAIADVDKNVLRPLGDSSFQPSNTNLTGAGGVESFRFEAANAGLTTLKLIYRRPWETGVAPARTFTVQVAVR
jgi:inhibitor of cysteine peptidase